MIRRKSVTMNDIAEKLGLSVNAVSLALNDRAGVSEETRKQILDTAEQMGYLNQEPQYILSFSNKNICILMKHRFFRDFRFYGRIILGIEEEAKKNGYDVFMNSFEEEEIPICVENRKVSGIIVVGKIEDSYLMRLKEYGIPVMLADHVSLEVPTDSIISDSKLGAYRLTSYLLKRGITKIGFFGDIEYTPSILERFLGYKAATQHYLHLGGFLESMEYVAKFSLLGDVENFVLKQNAKEIFSAFKKIPEKPDVLICSNDELAVFLMKTLQGKGYSIPEDIGVVGFDDIELSGIVSPALTTVHVPKKLMGQKAMRRLLYRIAHPKADIEKMVMDVEIVERESV